MKPLARREHVYDLPLPPKGQVNTILINKEEVSNGIAELGIPPSRDGN